MIESVGEGGGPVKVETSWEPNIDALTDDEALQLQRLLDKIDLDKELGR